MTFHNHNTNIRFFILLLCALCSMKSWSQQKNSTERVTRTKCDTIKSTIYAKYNSSLDSLRLRFDNWSYNASDTLSNPDYFLLFMPPTLYSDVISNQIGKGSFKSRSQSLRQKRIEAIERHLIDTYTMHPERIVYGDNERITAVSITEEKVKKIKHPTTTTPKTKPEHPQIAEQDEWEDLLEIEVKKPNFWKVKASTSLDFTQYYVSDNWYKGGESNISLLAGIIIDADFDNKQKLIFNNKLEMKLGFQTSKDDTKRKIRTNTDLIRMTNKLGWKAAKNWYYTTTLQTWTQFHPAYRKNEDKVYSDFMSPFEGLFTIGMDFSLKKKKGNLNLAISPLACNYKYVDRKDLAPSFGIYDGKNSKFQIGSNITMNYNWNIWKNISWGGRVYLFTDYHRTQIEWENTINLKINNFLSTKLFLYPRFDDSVTRKEGGSYFQFHELLSVGFDYNF